MDILFVLMVGGVTIWCILFLVGVIANNKSDWE